MASNKEALLAGAVSGAAVDTLLFPLDTIKTRLQAKMGFHASGGFKGIYKGLSSAVIGSAPSASAFFMTYEYMKKHLPLPTHVSHFFAATLGEIAACCIRVPTEVMKQRMQTKLYSSLGNAMISIYRSDGIFGFYRGYLMTLFREIPFSCIQFPLYESLKQTFRLHSNHELTMGQHGMCGAIAGGIAAALTTPLDVVKTRMMLSVKTKSMKLGIRQTFSEIYHQEGISAFFKGIGPRIMWISIGGFIFLGTYETSLKFIQN